MKTKNVLLTMSLVALLAPAGAFAQAPAAPAAPAAPEAAPPPPPLPASLGAPKVDMGPEVAVTKVGEVMPKGKFKNLDTGAEVDSATAFGKGVIVAAVMQTACAQCKQEVQFLQKVSENKDLAGKFTALAVVVDVNPGERVMKFKEDSKLTMTFLSDPGFEYAPQLGVDVTPAIFIVKDGKLAFTKMGFSGASAKEIVEQLKKLL